PPLCQPFPLPRPSAAAYGPPGRLLPPVPGPGYPRSMRGRKPKPTALKLLTGNPGKRPLNPNEPQPAPELPDCPDHLDEVGKAEWARVAAELGQLGILTRVDRAALAAYCSSYSRWVKLESMVQKFGEVLVDPETKRLYPNPYLGALNRALR